MINADWQNNDSPLLFNFALEYAIRRVQANQEGLKLNGADQLMVYGDDVNILGGSVHAARQNTEALLIIHNEIGLEVNADQTNCKFMSPEKNAGQYLTIKICNKSFERLE
jgi:hypothetical protein